MQASQQLVRELKKLSMLQSPEYNLNLPQRTAAACYTVPELALALALLLSRTGGNVGNSDS